MSASDHPDWLTLTDDEQVVWEGRPSPYPYLGGLLGPVGLVALGIAVAIVAAGVVSVGVPIPEAVPGVAIGGALVALGVALALGRIISWWLTRYVVTTEEVYHKRGVVSRSVTNTRLDQIQNTRFTQSATGRLFSYGDVYVDTAGGGGTEIVFRHVEEPQRVVGRITEELDRR